MPLFRLLFGTACLATFPVSTALAQDQNGTAPADRVAIITDQDAGAVRIVIDERDVATIDADGLHVRGDLNYSGTSTDDGQSGFDSHAAEAGQHEE